MMARILSLFLLIIFAGQSWGLVAPSSNDSYRYDGSRITENTQNRDYDVAQKSTGNGVRLPIEAFPDNVQGESFFAFIDGFFVTKGGAYKLKNADGLVKRTGKSNNLDRRRSEHVRNSETKDLEFEVDRRTDCCNAQRGREQIIYDQHPEAQSTNDGLNKRIPVSPTNPK